MENRAQALVRWSLLADFVVVWHALLDPSASECRGITPGRPGLSVWLCCWVGRAAGDGAAHQVRYCLNGDGVATTSVLVATAAIPLLPGGALAVVWSKLASLLLMLPVTMLP